MDFLEHLPPLGLGAAVEERWLVRDGDATRVAWILGDDDARWLADTMQATVAWLDFAHPRVSRIERVDWQARRAMFVVDDDRGPTIVDAAAQLAAGERERWTIAQLVAIAEALAAMRRHQADFVHRALEPAHVFVDASGHARLRAPVRALAGEPKRDYVGAGRVMGRPDYFAPEQAQGYPCTPASDVYALATILVHALTGASPYASDNPMEALVAILRGPAPTVPGASPALARALAGAFAKEPAARLPDPATFARALRDVVPDADEVDAVISDRIAAWWPSAEPARGTELLGGRCAKTWEALAPSDRPDVRHCHACAQDVVRVESLAAVIPLVGQHCIAIPRGSAR